jgi:hypothetical protein
VFGITKIIAIAEKSVNLFMRHYTSGSADGGGGGGGGGSQSSYDVAPSGGSGPGGGGSSSLGPTIIVNHYGPLVGTMQDLAIAIGRVQNTLNLSGQLRSISYNSLTNGPKQK